jgi:regulator of nucleoside diphosphate kinase
MKAGTEAETMTQTLLVTEPDRTRLRRLIDTQRPYAYANRLALDALEYELVRARVVSPGAVPANVVTMNSTVRVRDLGTDREETFTVVFPGAADPTQGRLSVLSAMGLAVLGARAGDVVRFPIRYGVRPMRVEEVVSQPEREGRFDL